MKGDPNKLFRRITASCLFLGGGLFTWFLVSALEHLGAALAGMSAGPVAGFPIREKLFTWLIPIYFLIGAISSLLLSKKPDLKMAAIFSHLLLIIALCLMGSESFAEGIAASIGAMIVGLFIMSVYFLPWMILWAKVIGNGTPVIRKVLPLQETPPSKIADKIKSKY